MSESTKNNDNTNRPHTELSQQYYKSRKQLMLFSGLFFVYEFIGVKIPSQPIPNSKIEIL